MTFKINGIRAKWFPISPISHSISPLTTLLTLNHSPYPSKEYRYHLFIFLGHVHAHSLFFCFFYSCWTRFIRGCCEVCKEDSCEFGRSSLLKICYRIIEGYHRVSFQPLLMFPSVRFRTVRLFRLSVQFIIHILRRETESFYCSEVYRYII